MGQKVYKHKTWSNIQFKGTIDGGKILNRSHAWLELKPLSSITDEDAKQIAIQNRYTNGKDDEAFVKVGKNILDRVFNIEKYYASEQMCLPSESADYLRSKGYALPCMGLSVEKLQEYRWIKLK